MKDDYPDWFLWAYQKGFVFWLCIAGVIGVVLLGIVLHLDDSIRNTEQRIQQGILQVGEEVQDVEDEQTRELREIREELSALRRDLDELRESK